MYIIFKAMEVNKSMLAGCSYSSEKVGVRREYKYKVQTTNMEGLVPQQKSPREAAT